MMSKTMWVVKKKAPNRYEEEWLFMKNDYDRANPLTAKEASNVWKNARREKFSRPEQVEKLLEEDEALKEIVEKADDPYFFVKEAATPDILINNSEIAPLGDRSTSRFQSSLEKPSNLDNEQVVRECCKLLNIPLEFETLQSGINKAL